MKNLNFIFVCHYFPPDNSSGVRRVSFWANYLAAHGHNVTVIHSRKRKALLRPIGLDQRVHLVDFHYGNMRRLNLKESGLESVTDIINYGADSKIKNFLVYIKRRFFNPFIGQLADPNLFSVLATLGVLFFKRRRLTTLVESKSAVVISSAPPWSTHLLGWGISKILQRPWVIDYRDQFSRNHMFGGALGIVECEIDKFLCGRANCVVTVSESMAQYYLRFSSSVKVIHNGFDPSLFWPMNSLGSSAKSNPATTVIRYMGTIQHKSRLPIILFEGLLQSTADVLIEFYGDVPLVVEYLQEHPELNGKVKCLPGVAFQDVRELMATADFNLLCETLEGSSLSHRGVMTSKMFEYLSVQRPILALVSQQSDMISVLRQSGLLIGPWQTSSEVAAWLNGLSRREDVITPKKDVIESFSRTNGAKQLITIVEGLG